jgi:DNA-binding protein HU-beta
MRKREIVSRICARTDRRKEDVSLLFDVFLEIIEETLMEGRPVALYGFGTFLLRYRSAYAGTNPYTREPMIVTARAYPAFKPSRRLELAIRAKHSPKS